MHTVGAAQVFAGPGSGKTYVTVHRIQHLITVAGIEPSHILVITFTKAAALEMQERFFYLMEPERPAVRFGTFHAVFYHILKQSAQYRDYTIITESEKKKILRQIIHIQKRFACLQEEDMEELIASISVYKLTSVVRPLAVRKISEEDIIFLTKEYIAYQHEFRQMDFDDIVINCHQLLLTQPETLAYWQRQFQFILIDEFQDISPDQYAIIMLLAAPDNNLFIVGDDDQSIYGFRGADPGSMQQFMQDYPTADKIFLNVNYRCNRQIVDASMKVVGENRNRIEKQMSAAHENGDGFSLQIFDKEAEQEESLIESLRRNDAEGKLAGCALICRTNYDCAMWAQSLHRNGIPYYMKEAPRNRFQHFVIRDIMAYLALAQGELCRKHFLRIMNRPVRYLRRECVPEERVSEEELSGYYKGMPVLQERIRKLFEQLRVMSTKRLHLQIHYIRNVIGYDRYLLEKYGADKAEELIRIAVEFQQLSERFCTFTELNDYISQYSEILKEAMGGVGEENTEQENVRAGIRLMTMHASKGLEFDTVYVPDCQEGKIPYARSQTPEEIEEERRMFYVAMTRAKKELYLMAYKGKSGKDAPSRFLKCLCQSVSSISSSNSAESRYSSNASATASYSSSSSI